MYIYSTHIYIATSLIVKSLSHYTSYVYIRLGTQHMANCGLIDSVDSALLMLLR